MIEQKQAIEDLREVKTKMEARGNVDEIVNGQRQVQIEELLYTIL